MGKAAAVLFDLDGTLVDSEEYWIHAETTLLAQYGRQWSHEQAMQLVGRSLDVSGQILQNAGVDLPVSDIVGRLSASVRAQMSVSLPWRPGARELLGLLRSNGVATALVTMSPMSIAANVAERAESELGVRPFDVLITGDTVTWGKPHPEPYLVAAERLGVSPDSSVAIEDSPTGISSAVAAGTATVAVPNMVDIPASESYVIWQTLAERTLADLARTVAWRSTRG